MNLFICFQTKLFFGLSSRIWVGAPDISNLSVLAEVLGISVDELLRGELAISQLNTKDYNEYSLRKELTPKQKKERAIIALASSIGAILGILAYNFGWLG